LLLADFRFLLPEGTFSVDAGAVYASESRVGVWHALCEKLNPFDDCLDNNAKWVPREAGRCAIKTLGTGRCESVGQ
jgi:hypothetical protein